MRGHHSLFALWVLVLVDSDCSAFIVRPAWDATVPHCYDGRLPTRTSRQSALSYSPSNKEIDVFSTSTIKLKSLPKLERQVTSRILDEEATVLLKNIEPQILNWTSHVEIMSEWAGLGKAEKAKDFYGKVAKATDSMPTSVRVAFLRRLLHAWSNRLELVKQSPAASETADNALRVLQQMTATTEGEDGSNLDATDFTRIVRNYLDVTPLNVTAVYDAWQLWQKQPNMPPLTAQLSAKVIRSVANQDAKTWEEAMKNTDIAMKLGSAALSAIDGELSGTSDKEEETLKIYNSLLELWSKLLPPPSKQKSFLNFPVSEKERTLVGQRTKALLAEMEDAGIHPNPQTYTTILYAYCKCGWLEEAWVLWKEWKQAMLKMGEGMENAVDARSLLMLIQSSLVQAEQASDVAPSGKLSPLEHARLATQVLDDMWELYDRGILEMKPSVDLYTWLLQCWACPRLKSESIDITKKLVADLMERYKSLSDASLQPNTNFYSAWQSVVRSHFGSKTISVAEQAGLIVDQMEYQSIDNPAVAPDTGVYNFLIDACLSDGSNKVGMTRAEQTLNKMLDASPSSSTKSPNGRSFASVIRAYLEFDTAKAEQWLDRMEELFIPSSDLFQEVILKCCEETKTAEEGAERRRQAERARRLLNRMEELSKVTSNAQLQPDLSLYSSVTEACERAGLEKTESETRKLGIGATKKDKRRKKRVTSNEDIFKLMKDLGMLRDGAEFPEADTLTCNRVIAQLAKTGKIDAGKLAEEIFDHMLDEYVNHAHVMLKPDLVTFNSVILAWSKSSHDSAAVGAEAFLNNIRSLHSGGMLLDVEPDCISYNTVISAYQRSNNPRSAEEAERVFNELLSLHDSTNDDKYRPDEVSICSLLGAYAIKGNSQRAEELLLHFWKEHKVYHSQVAPDTSCFDQVLRAWAKTGKEHGAHRAETLLELMEDMASSPESVVKPTTTTYNIVLHALANSGDIGAPLRAQELLEKMKVGGPKNNSAWPDNITYTTTISVMGRLAGRQALDTIESLLEEAVNAPDINVDSTFFANVLSSLALCGNRGAVNFAQDLVEKKMRYLGVKPDIFVWNSLLNCLAKRGMGEEAERILERLESASLNVQPNVQTYSIVLDAYAKSAKQGSIARAETILQRMQDSKSCRPDARAYTALIQKYARSNLPLKAKRAQAVLQKMKEGAQGGNAEMTPTVVTYNALLNACEYTNSNSLQEAEAAFEVACAVFDEVQKVKGLNPTHATYGTFLGVVANLMPRSEARNEIVTLVFKRCRKEGQVSSYVLRKLKSSISLKHYRQLLEGHREDRLPRKWTANVRQRRNDGLVGGRRNRSSNKSSSFVGR